jgi:plastocyanin
MGRARLRRTFTGLAAGGALVASLGACGTDAVPQNADLIAGKRAFVKSCGACHTLTRAGTKGTQGPDLDNAFRESVSEGLGRDTVRGVVHQQILHPARVPQDSKAYMPPKLVDGKLAGDVASYVASVAGLSGKDTGRLGSAVQAAGAGKPIAAKGGKLEIPTDPNGQLAYLSKVATATAGMIEIDSPNKTATPHNIAIEGSGVSEKGEIVQNGGVSKISVSLKPGDYTYFCSVPGHREAGMEGKLTVK